MRSLTSSVAAPEAASFLRTVVSTGRPTIISARADSLTAPGTTSPTTAPRRSTAMRSAISRTSAACGVMNTITFASVEQAVDDPEEPRPPGGDTAVGLVDQDVRLPKQHLDDLDPLLHANGQGLDEGIGIDGESGTLPKSRPRRCEPSLCS